ncbi:MAG TPA: hypothetical protein EYG98_03050 [Sulfurovum sp.]|nr:hypothetical protein [Sulfurovum sp.]
MGTWYVAYHVVPIGELKDTISTMSEEARAKDLAMKNIAVDLVSCESNNTFLQYRATTDIERPPCEEVKVEIQKVYKPKEGKHEIDIIDYVTLPY